MTSLDQVLSEMSKGPEAALNAELFAYNKIIKSVETAENFKACYERLKTPLLEYGYQAGASLPEIKIRPTIPPTVGFFIPITSGNLAHKVNLLTYLKGKPPIKPIVYTAKHGDPSLDAICTVRQVSNLSHVERWKSLRTMSTADNVSAMVFVSITTGMAFASAMKVAPKHIWWSMKYHGLELPTLDGYMATSPYFTEEAEIEGRKWMCCHSVLPDLFDASLTPEAQQIKSKLSATTLGCIGREEKLLNRRYAAALGKILRACPEAVYIWSGRKQPPEFVAWLKEEGIHDRCRFVGWVNTKVAAQVIDVYLDSFPFASGHTAFEAMAAGNPLVVLITPESLETSTATAILPVHSGKVGTSQEQTDVQAIFAGTLPYVQDIDAYVNHAIRLVKEPEFRRLCGAAGKAFIERYMYDVPRHVALTTRHILRVIGA